MKGKVTRPFITRGEDLAVDVVRCARLSETHLATTQLEASGLTAEPINVHTMFPNDTRRA
jgi:hypothetical protein